MDWKTTKSNYDIAGTVTDIWRLNRRLGRQAGWNDYPGTAGRARWKV